ncbi:hypothetical protein ACS0TY_018638 [Phlomoides rotata]
MDLVHKNIIHNLKEVECSPLVLPSFSSNLENLSSLHVEFYGIDTCNNIPEDALQGLCNLKRLKVSDAMKDVVPEKWSRDINFLTQSMLYDCCLPVGWLGHLTSLEELHIFECSELENFAEEFKQLHVFKYLTIANVDDMVSLPQSLQQIPSLQYLLLRRLPLLTSLPDWLANLASLTSLIIKDCPKIDKSSSIQGMTNSVILRSPELERRCEKANDEDWSKIADIPQLYIYSPF